MFVRDAHTDACVDARTLWKLDVSGGHYVGEGLNRYWLRSVLKLQKFKSGNQPEQRTNIIRNHQISSKMCFINHLECSTKSTAEQNKM